MLANTTLEAANWLCVKHDGDKVTIMRKGNISQKSLHITFLLFHDITKHPDYMSLVNPSNIRVTSLSSSLSLKTMLWGRFSDNEAMPQSWYLSDPRLLE